MPKFSTNQLRNVVLMSHSGAGKTILSEAMLHTAGVTTRLGSVEEGTTISDFEPEEERRHGSVQTSVITCPWRDNKIDRLDTPGHADFRGEVISAIQVADAAIIVVACPYGIEVGTSQMWKMANEKGLPRLVYISNMDRENADFDRVMDSITERFGRQCFPIQLPIGAESDFTGIVNLLDSAAEALADMADVVDAAREHLIEAVVEADDELTNKYLKGEEISQAELISGLRQGISAGLIVPVMIGATTSQIRTSDVLDAIVDFMPSPADVGPVLAMSEDGETSLPPKNDGPLAALVFKTAADLFVGKLSYFRVYSGNLASETQLINANTTQAERIGQVYVINGKEQEAVTDLATGDIGATPKLNSVLTGHILCTKENQMTLGGPEFSLPLYQMAVLSTSACDFDKMTSSLARIVEEDPSLSVTREPDTLEVLLGGLGDTHVEIAVEKMKRKFGSEMVLELPKMAYKETVAGTAKVEYRLKKQSGGHGQYGHVKLEIAPLERGAGFEFAQTVVGGSVSREYIPSVEKGVATAMEDGAIAGYPIVDVKATLFDGSFHTVDSSGICFEITGSHALVLGVQQANPLLLEPVMRVQITLPNEFAGDIIGDLNAKRGRIQGMMPQGDGETLLEAEMPQAELLRYATDLRSMTQGQGTFTMEFDHYEQVPGHLVEGII